MHVVWHSGGVHQSVAPPELIVNRVVELLPGFVPKGHFSQNGARVGQQGLYRLVQVVAGGFLAGSAGLPGPPIILLYMSSTLPAAAVRANNTLYLITVDVVMVVTLFLKGVLTLSASIIGGVMILPYLLGNWLGALLFRPGAEVLYRRIGYAIIALSALMGLPIWD